jgi:sulfatase modifying factor 1
MRNLHSLMIVLCFAFGIAQNTFANGFVQIPGGEFESVIPEAEGDNLIQVNGFYLQESPVTNADFLRFVLHQPQWQRDKAASLFVDDQYLSSWSHTISLGPAESDIPVTGVSWFAANAYCQWKDARLPSWYEWEFAAAASETMADARSSDEWRQKILSWYSESSGAEMSQVHNGEANFYGIYDIHGLIWEWVDDANAFMVTGDNREQGGADQLQFCGAGAITMEQKENYAVLMRVAMLSSLEARYTTKNLGFRCARNGQESL